MRTTQRQGHVRFVQSGSSDNHTQPKSFTSMRRRKKGQEKEEQRGGGEESSKCTTHTQTTELIDCQISNPGCHFPGLAGDANTSAHTSPRGWQTWVREMTGVTETE